MTIKGPATITVPPDQIQKLWAQVDGKRAGQQFARLQGAYDELQHELSVNRLITNLRRRINELETENSQLRLNYERRRAAHKKQFAYANFLEAKIYGIREYLDKDSSDNKSVFDVINLIDQALDGLKKVG